MPPSHPYSAQPSPSETLASSDFAWVHAGLFDNDGVFREKRLPAALAREYASSGWSFIDALPHWTPDEGTRSDRAWRSEACVLDLESVRPYPFEPDAALVVADYAGPTAEISARPLLRRLEARARDAGLNVQAAVEYEFILLSGSPDEVSANGFEHLKTFAQENRCWSGAGPAGHASLLAGYDARLRAGSIDLHHWCSELGPGCFEIALPSRALVTAADEAALVKQWTRAHFAGLGFTASFMAQLSEQHPGLGGHPIISLHDTAGENLLVDRARPTGLSEIGEAFLAGVLHGLPELMALFATTTNAYRRYAPGNWAPRTATWGHLNYTCGVRVVAEPEANARLELRLPGADMPAHLAFAMFLGAGLDGVERGLALPPETAGIGRDAHHPDIGPLPRTLAEAAERLARSERARALFGDRFVDHHAAVCRHEADALARHVPAPERARYLFHV